MKDWTASRGKSNSSTAFLNIVEAVAVLILNEAHPIVAGRRHDAARLIVAQLAHVHGLAPQPKVRLPRKRNGKQG
jgi:hypothetical protein